MEPVEAVSAPGGRLDGREAAALLGTVPESAITLTKAMGEYGTFSRDKLIGKSADQARQWKNPRIKAVRNLVVVIGDKPIDQITRDDMLDFRQWWLGPQSRPR